MDEKRACPRVSLHTEIWLGQDGIFTRTYRMLRDHPTPPCMPEEYWVQPRSSGGFHPG